MTDNVIGDEGAKTMSEGLKANSALKELNLYCEEERKRKKKKERKMKKIIE